MSHKTRCGQTTFIHNGGYDGDVNLVNDSEEITVPMEDLAEFVAGYVRGALISWAEQADYKEVLLGHFGSEEK